MEIDQNPKFRRLVSRLQHVCKGEPPEFVTTAIVSIAFDVLSHIDTAARRGIAIALIKAIAEVEDQISEHEEELDRAAAAIGTPATRMQ